MKYLDQKKCLEIYEKIMNIFPGSKGIRDNNLFISAVNNPQLIMFGQELYPTIEDKSAIFIYSIVHNHVFQDGNKRTGYALLDYFLDMNGYGLKASENEKYNFLNNVASGKYSLEDTKKWFEGKIK